MHNRRQMFAPAGFLRAGTSLAALAAGSLWLSTAQVAAQSPQGGVVASGAATISKTASQSVIQQSTQRAVIDWQGFDVGRDHTVVFDQPGRSSATLNRVQSVSPSLIEGTITAPGTVVIQNTAGVLFTGTARVDTGGLVAASQIVDAGYFLNSGNYRIGGGERPGARVVNEGSFTIGDAGLAALVGTDVENAGVIMAHMGTVALASGTQTTIDLSGDGVFQIAVNGAPEGGRVSHTGTINASGGQVLLTAGGAAGALDSVINTSGVIRAASGSRSGGSIRLVGRGGGAVRVAGKADASSDKASGGSIWVLGETIDISASAVLSADGAAAGGEILIGGDVKGSGPLRRAAETRVRNGAEISADGASGPGGRVVVWADQSTWFDGMVSATGTISGGFLETSGRINLDIGENAQVSLGQGGQWLLDPRNVNIVNSGADVVAGVNNPPAGAGDFLIRRNSILSVLNAGSDVTITTEQAGSTDDGNITLSSALRWNGAGSLTLDADAGIFINNSLQTRGAGDLTLAAGTDIVIQRDVQSRGTGDIQMTAGGNVTVNQNVQTRTTGNISIDAGGFVDLNRAVFSRGAGNVAIRADGTATVDRFQQNLGAGGYLIDAGDELVISQGIRSRGAGTVDLRAQNNVTANSGISSLQGGDLTILSRAGDVTVNSGVTTRQGGDLTIEAATGNVTTNGSISAREGGDLTIQTVTGDVTTDGNVATRGGGDLTIRTQTGDLAVSRSVTAHQGGAVTIETTTGNVTRNGNTETRNGGNLTIQSGTGTVEINGSAVARGGGDIALQAQTGDVTTNGNVTALDGGDIAIGTRVGDVEINRNVTTRNGGDVTLQTAMGDITINRNVVALGDGDLTVLAQSGDVIFGGSGANQVLRTQNGRMLLEATSGSVLLERTNTTNRNTQVFSDAGAIDVVAGTEIRLQGGTGTRQFARLGRTRDSSDISLTAPTVSILGGNGSNRGNAQVLAGADGSISIDADTLTVANGTGGARGQIQALGGATLDIDAGTQTWDGFVRGTGDTTLTGDITATVRPRFDLNDGSDFTLASGSFGSANQRLDVRTAADSGAGGIIRIGGPVEARTVLLETDAGVRIDSGARITGTAGGTPVVVAAGASFRNDAGSDVLQTTAAGSRWLLYIDTFAGLTGTEPASGQFDLYNRPYASTPPGSLGAFTGNRIVYGEQPTLTFTATSLTKTYGEDVTASLGFSVSGLRSGDSEATALTAPASVTSAGADASAPVAGSPFTISMAATASDQGYNVVTNDGTLTINPAALTIAANDASRDVGEANPVFTETITGFVPGETLADLSGTLTLTTPATLASPAGIFAITPAGVSSDNYAITFVDGALTVGTLLPEGFAASDLTEAGAIGERRAGLRAYPLTPGDAAFRTTERDAPLAQADPFALTYSLGEVVTFAQAGDTGSQGFVPAAGGLDEDASGDCGVAANIGTAPRAGCVPVVRAESYWDRR
ncbi:MBG domain-containing protein [uncultured Roseobacter sp.]|uniref:beta strand repeat-containing protein n=1 Tax=uncultured Roseobacter sp. TaxID=114847 RepID=UPI002601F4F6|nr:MBG domain-containing protein [uncultured Roseobacter sp.]